MNVRVRVRVCVHVFTLWTESSQPHSSALLLGDSSPDPLTYIQQQKKQQKIAISN